MIKELSELAEKFNDFVDRFSDLAERCSDFVEPCSESAETILRAMDFLGEWRQIRPDPAPGMIVVRFEPDGRLTYTIDNQPIQLTWRLEGDMLVVNDDQRSRFRFRSPTVLIIERGDERFVYYRV